MFDLKDMENMERHESPAVEMIKRLRQHALPIARLYKTMRSLNLLAPISAQPTTTPTLTHNGSSAFFTDSDVNYVQKLIQNNIKAYEVILPIVNADNGDIVYESEHNVYANGSFNNFNAMFSNTAIVYVKSRKLRCLKVTFDDQQGYTKELQMIKWALICILRI